ncbi:MAG: hypothetical protein GXO40_01055 [Epsilonproteobacteria bacterium]|nr:hypothetical protein [Campylobacterota bacterium]
MKLPSINLPKLPKIEMFGIDIIKNMLFFVLFVIVFLVLLALFVAPSIKKFKSVKDEYYQTKMTLDTTQRQLDAKTKEYQKLFIQNKRIIYALKRDFDVDNFKYFAKRYMNVLNIQEKNTTTYKKRFIKTTYIVTAKLKTPTNFYKFVSGANNYKCLIEVYFPIIFKAANGEITLLYKLEHFKQKPTK